MTLKEIKNKVIEIIADKVYFSAKEIQESTRFKEDLGTDSLDDIELVMEFEREFGIKIPDEEMLTVSSTVRTVGEAIDEICQKLGVSFCKQQQSEVDLEEEMDKYYDSPLWDGDNVSWMTYTRIARHFYELGLNARKEE